MAVSALDIPQPDTGPRPLQIGLVNNMPDAALQATERQFRALLQEAAGARPVRLRLFHMAGIPRGEMARRVLARDYAPLDALPCEGLDALIVTGAEPLASRLQDEPYWGVMGELVDWAGRHTRSTLWSCLGAHAAVLRLDGIERRRLPSKCSGVFAFDVAAAHPLTEGLDTPVLTPHSRHNALAEAELTASGYTVLTRSATAGVDAFVREGTSRFLFLQGHPEYDADALRLEYRRDLRRFLAGEQAAPPHPPHRAFDPATEARLTALLRDAAADPRPDRFPDFAAAMAQPSGEAAWRPAWRRIYGNWLEALAQPLARETAPA